MKQSGDKQNLATKDFERLRLPQEILDRYPKEALVINMFEDSFKTRSDSTRRDFERTIDVTVEREVRVKYIAAAQYSEPDDRTLYQIVLCKQNPMHAVEREVREQGIVGAGPPRNPEGVDPEFAKQRWWPCMVMDVEAISGNDVGLAIDAAVEMIHNVLIPRHRLMVLQEVRDYARVCQQRMATGMPAPMPPWIMTKKLIIS